MSDAAAAQVIEAYSTSFSLAGSLLRGRVHTDVRNIYAVVRIADEVVDGVAGEAGLDRAHTRQLLDAFEREVLDALGTGFSTNPAVHAFATTARHANIGEELIRDFFAAMRRDLSPAELTDAELRRYIHGSAETVGLMCLAVFTADSPMPADTRATCKEGALALGRAFQNVNFLRDSREDVQALGRRYFGCLSDGPESGITDRLKVQVLDSVDEDLAAAYATVGLLPTSSRTGVLAALLLFAELSRRLRRAPAAEITEQRIRVPGAAKLQVVARAVRLAPGLRGGESL